MNRVPLAVVILTYNEEANLEGCLQSVTGWADEVFIVDSFSTDSTMAIARRYTERIVQHRFEGYAQQRNWALDRLPFSHEWVLFLDADEQVSAELQQELSTLWLEPPKEIDGFYIKRRLIFMARWIRYGGYYPTWILRLFRHKAGRCDERSVNEHFHVQGRTGQLQHDLLHEDRRDISFWTDKHNRYATLEANELRIANCGGRIEDSDHRQLLKASLWGTQAERKRWLRERVWNRLPLLLRPMLYFVYRYFLRLGFLDGKAGLIYHFLQGLWFPFLIDVKYLEIKHDKGRELKELVTHSTKPYSYNASNHDVRG
jgi:glycosyltransferase involved in cell wall biosynthesis